MPSASSASGFTSTIVQSASTKSLYSALICSAAAFLSPLTLRPSTTVAACASVIPSAIEIGTLMIFSGELAARSSIDVPPSEHAMIRGPSVARSSMIAKYISFTSFIFFARSSVSTGLPSGPDCFVTSVCPSILPAYSSTCDVLITCTPPWKPFLNVPSPRPPARICDLITTSSSPIFAAAATASATDFAAMPIGTFTPFSAMSCALWYSCKFSRRTAPSVRGRRESAEPRESAPALMTDAIKLCAREELRAGTERSVGS